MASEINVALRFSFSKSGDSDGVDFAFTPTFAGTKWIRGRQALSVAEEAINLGEATGGGGWALFWNRDATNNIHIRQATGAANFLTLLPGECNMVRLSTATTAPFAIASAGTPELGYLILTA